MMFEKILYSVARLDGDYAYLSRLGRDGVTVSADCEEKCVARALLPAEISEGSRLAYELMEYSMVSE